MEPGSARQRVQNVTQQAAQRYASLLRELGHDMLEHLRVNATCIPGKNRGTNKSTIYLVGAPADKQENILAIPWKDILIIPDLGANGIKTIKSVRSEFIGPMGLLLLVDMVRSSLRRYGCAE
jgi:hypothetical protein